MIFRLLLFFFIVSACGIAPGFKEEPSSKNPKKMGLEQNGVTLMFYDLNKMDPAVLPRIEEIKKKSKDKFNEANVHSRVFMKDLINLLDDYSLYRIMPGGKILELNNPYNAITHEIFGTQNIIFINNNKK